MHFLNTVLNDAAWWYDQLSEEYGREANWSASALIGPIRPDISMTNVILKSLSEAFKAYDERLATQGVDITCVARHIRDQRTYLGALKKFSPFEEVPNSLATAAVLGFYARNSEVKGNVIPRRFQPYMRARLAHVLCRYEEAKLSCVPHFGPGAVAEGMNNLEKWQEIPKAAKAAGYNYLDSEIEPEWLLQTANLEQLPAKLKAVPKDWDKARLITIEPLALTMLQHMHRDAMVRTLEWETSTRHLVERSAMDPTTGITRNIFIPQENHRRLALAGSRDGSYATFDLSDASDRIGYGQVAQVFPARVMSDLDFSRSTSCTDYVGMDDKTTKSPGTTLHMYAGMGNATTFVVETLLFWAMCHAVADYHRVGRRFVSVVGDDIVTDRRLAKLLVDTGVFDDFGWRLNLRKSMWLPGVNYRESCGIQAFRGEDVTLTRVSGYRDTPEGALGVVELIHSFARQKHYCIAEQVWRQTTLPNVAGAPMGTLSVDLDWLPRTDVPSRWCERYYRTEYNLKSWNAMQFHSSPNRTEYLFGALSGQLSTKFRACGVGPSAKKVPNILHLPNEQGVVRRPLEGRWRTGKVDSVFATLQRRGTVQQSWRETARTV